MASYPLDIAHPQRLLFLNSKQAAYSPGEAKYIWHLQETISCPKNHVFLISIIDAQIPYSYYQINENNRFYYFNNAPFSVPLGNYNILELIQKLKSNHPAITFTYLETTNKLTLSSTTSFRIENNLSYEAFLPMLGFKLDIYEGTTLTSDSVVDLSGYNNIFIFSSNLSPYNVDSYESRGSNVLAKIPVTSSSNGIIFYTTTGVKQVINTVSISDIRLQLLDNLYFPLDLNGVPFTITISLEILRQTEEQDNPFQRVQFVPPPARN